jgi:trehalose synthase
MSEERFEHGRRRALVVAAGRYRHDELPDLYSPSRDADAVKRVLGNPSIGGFDSIQTLVDRDLATVYSGTYDFFSAAQPDEFLFVYFSCHGRRTPNGRLYLAMIDTDPNRLPPTALPSDFLAEQFDSCRAHQVVLVLDCCHAGAFTADPRLRGSRDRLLVLTAGATEYAHEGDTNPGGSKPSAFAGAFFEGIETGRADDDNNGLITVREAFDYAVRRLRDTGAKQTPQMRAGVTGDLVLCRAPVRPGALPAEIASLVRHSLPSARQAAIDVLARWLSSSDIGRIAAAEEALTELRRDPDERVAQTATRLLARRLSTKGSHRVVDVPVLERDADPLWFRRAVLYEIRVRTFADSNDDGVGDLQGLIDRLEYLHWLQVDCIILSPIFDSPLDDDGDDISDFRSVHPELGNIADLVELVDAAHRRGIRVLLDLVLNHTSNKHPWFEESRRAPDGPYGPYYVWSDNDELFVGPPAPTADHHEPGWTYDPVRRQYYWHRFKSSEPDLNFDCPAVQEEILEVIRYWLDLGVDGFRLISAPYLFERDGTPCEGLDETHAYLRRLRATVDEEYPDRILLAWAERWPAQAGDYFGDEEHGPECHVVLYTSLMPRIFLAMRGDNHGPVSALLAQAHAAPQGCQWGVFLRNGDEMSLDTVDEHERAYLLKEHAPLPRMRTRAGVRRRLAPMLDDDRRQLDLCMALLLSMPGAPILYYGDEIGMGENLALTANAAVRTPMQWSTEAGGGFSRAEPEQFVLPVVLNSTYGYQAVNVAAQRANASSPLNWVRRLIEIRRHSDALSLGTSTSVTSTNPAVLAFVREAGADRMLCVANFSRYPQQTALDLEAYRGAQLIEASGGSRFGLIGDAAYPLALASYGFFWFRLVDELVSA